MKKYIVLAIVAAFLVVGCKTPNWLVSNNFHGNDKVVKEYFTPTTQAGTILSGAEQGSEANPNFFNYSMRVCNVDDNGTYAQCMDTVVLENVIQDAAYGNFGNH